MKNSNLDTLVKQYIVDAIDLECYDDSASNPQEAAQKVIGYIRKESVNLGTSFQTQVADHLAGLPSYINIAFYNNEILDLAVEWGSLDNLDNERANNKIIVNWFNFIAAKLLQIADGYHIKSIKWEYQ